MANATDTPTITVGNVQPGMLLDFGGELVSNGDVSIYLGEAEVISVSAPVGSDEQFSLWVSPEDGSVSDVLVHCYPFQSYPIAG